MLSAVRRVGVSAGAKAVRAQTKFAMSTFDDREKGAEAKFVRELEAKRAAAHRAELERILALEDTHAHKQELVQLLDKKPAETMMSRLQKWNYFVPLGILVGVPALVNEGLVIDMETQILGAFVFTVAAVYNEFGTAIGDALDGERKEVANAMKSVDDSLLQNVHEAVATNENMLDLEAQVKDIHGLSDDMAVLQADYLNHHEEHKYRDAVARKLDALVALEDTASNAIRARMMAKVQADVVNSFKTDAKAKDAALAQALAVLSASNNKTGAKMTTDVVGQYYASSLKSYKEAYAKQPAGSDEIINKLEADMNNIMKAPQVSHTGGNVYELKASAKSGH